MCEECSHRHAANVYCHVVVEKTFFDSLDDSDDSNSANGLGSDDDSEDFDLKSEDEKIGFNFLVKSANEAIATEKKMKLRTPAWAKAIEYGRCNCKVGVPNKSARFDPVPSKMFVGPIRILQYDDLIEDTTVKSRLYDED